MTTFDPFTPLGTNKTKGVVVGLANGTVSRECRGMPPLSIAQAERVSNVASTSFRYVPAGALTTKGHF